jgi:AcrR family transcriptional regulator
MTDPLPNPEDVVLDTAMHLFWARGAEATSYEDIVRATGLSRKGLYARWPDKSRLLGVTLAHYRATVLAGMLAALDRGLADFWDRLSVAVADPAWLGCYLIRTGSGPLRNETFVQPLFTEYLSTLTAAFARTLAGHATPLPVQDSARAIVAVLVLMSTRAAARAPTAETAELLALGRRLSGLSQAPQALGPNLSTS